MAELDKHIALMQVRRTALMQEIGVIHDGHRKTYLQSMLKQINDQLEGLKARSLLMGGHAKPSSVG